MPARDDGITGEVLDALPDQAGWVQSASYHCQSCGRLVIGEAVFVDEHAEIHCGNCMDVNSGEYF